MAFECLGKISWLEPVGAKVEEATKKVEKENGNVSVIVVREGTLVAKDFKCNRVWVWVNDHGIVIRVPKVG